MNADPHEVANLLRRTGERVGDERLLDRAVLIETESDDDQRSELQLEAIELLCGRLFRNGVKTERSEPAVRPTGLDGAAFVLDPPETVPSIWGDDDNVAWASGEPLVIAGPQGVGKTTAAQRLALLRSGVYGGELCGMPVEVGRGRVLYIAADRPRQAARSFRRMVSEAERQALSAALVVWSGPLPFDLGKAAPGQLVEFVGAFPEVDTVFVDSLKDVAVGLTDDEVGAQVNAEHQRVIAGGYELVVLHHQRKATGDNRKPRLLDDVYGSTWLTAGAGSVLLLWGQAGDPIVELRHLKQPSGEVGPLTLIHDHEHGAIGLHERVDAYQLVHGALSGGIAVRDAASQLFGSSEPGRNEIEKARRQLERLVERGRAMRTDENPVRYRPVARGIE
jgi:replicative DNA helicase